MPTATDLQLVDDLIALARLRGDSADAQRWAQVRPHMAPPDAHAPAHLVPDSRDLAALTRDGWIVREQAIADLPSDLRWLFESGAASLDEIARLVQAVDTVTLADLRSAIASGAARDSGALSADVVHAIAEALPALRSQVPRIPLGRALYVATLVLDAVRRAPGVVWTEPAGSLRRGYDLVGDIDLVVCGDDTAAVIESVTAVDGSRLLYRAPRRVIAAVGHTQVSLRIVPATDAAPTLLYATGHHGHVAQLERLAATQKMTLSRRGLFTSEGRARHGATEDTLYGAVGLPFIPAELRRGEDEIERARAGAIPDLVQRTDLLGDLHTHTTWSDGRDDVEAMAREAVRLGHRYLAITDHSPSSDAAKKLHPDDVARQADEVARVRELFPQLTLLHGCEVDILRDGRLDFPDKTLRRFDFVIASLHDRAGQSSQQLFRRYLAAMLHPLVGMITHPANRHFPRADGYDLDYDRLFEAAIETRTALEIDGAPSHIDLEASLAARAAARGVLLAINSDGHAVGHLDRHLQIGVLTARRAAVERTQVLNARPWPEIRAILAAKRRGFPV